MHGTMDHLVPIEHGVEVFRAALAETKRIHIMWNCSHTSYSRAFDIALPVAMFLYENHIDTSCDLVD